MSHPFWIGAKFVCRLRGSKFLLGFAPVRASRIAIPTLIVDDFVPRYFMSVIAEP